jgi:hypothetical protein
MNGLDMALARVRSALQPVSSDSPGSSDSGATRNICSDFSCASRAGRCSFDKAVAWLPGHLLGFWSAPPRSTSRMQAAVKVSEPDVLTQTPQYLSVPVPSVLRNVGRESPPVVDSQGTRAAVRAHPPSEALRDRPAEQAPGQARGAARYPSLSTTRSNANQASAARSAAQR